jgi:hypothetical protein
MGFRSRAWLAVLLCVVWSAAASADEAFRFETVDSLEAMTNFVHQRFVLGTPRDDLRRAFVTQGHATLMVNPADANVEKYLYDIDLCGYYVWRWNVSADFDADRRLRQAWVNGEPVFADGPQKPTPPTASAGRRQAILKGSRERPEAIKGETSLAYVTLDPDIDARSPHARFVVGSGPSRPDPLDFGKTWSYVNVDLWRSIFDPDDADAIVPYAGNCRTVDATLKRTFTKPLGK